MKGMAHKKIRAVRVVIIKSDGFVFYYSFTIPMYRVRHIQTGSEKKVHDAKKLWRCITIILTYILFHFLCNAHTHNETTTQGERKKCISHYIYFIYVYMLLFQPDRKLLVLMIRYGFDAARHSSRQYNVFVFLSHQTFRIKFKTISYIHIERYMNSE